MKAWVKNRARQAAGELLFQTRWPNRGGGLAILMFHSVTPRDLRDPMQMSVSAPQFARQMSSLRALDADIVPLADGVARLRQPASRLAVSVVFDDGFVGVHDHAAGILAAHRIPATVFVTTDWVGRPATPAADPRLGRPMTWAEIRTVMESSAMTIGSHTATHAVLARLPMTDIDQELRRSRDAIADQTGREPRQFAYPFGTYGTFDRRTLDALAASGFDIGCTTVWGLNDDSSNHRELRRIRVSWCDSPREIRKSLAGCYDWYRVIQRLQTHGRQPFSTNGDGANR